MKKRRIEKMTEEIHCNKCDKILDRFDLKDGIPWEGLCNFCSFLAYYTQPRRKDSKAKRGIIPK